MKNGGYVQLTNAPYNTFNSSAPVLQIYSQ